MADFDGWNIPIIAMALCENKKKLLIARIYNNNCDYLIIIINRSYIQTLL